MLAFACSSILYSQAGYGIYSFLDFSTSSRITALGGANVSLADNDLNFAFQNPALLTAKNHNMLSLNVANYLADIIYGTAAYGYTINDKNFLGFGVQYVDYGNFIETSVTNEELGTFTAKDIALNLSYARVLSDRLTIGTTLKPIFLVYERKTSFGIGVDAGLSYVNEENFFSAGLVFRNIGTQLKGFHSDETGQYLEPLPFNIELGFTQKLRHAPLRFSATFHNLQQWDLSYQSTNQPSTSLIGSSEDTKKSSGFFDLALRHVIVGAEFVPSNNFYLIAAYNFRRARELSADGFKSMAGFSFGGGVKLSKFHVGFGMAQFQVGNYSYHFSISTSLEEFGL